MAPLPNAHSTAAHLLRIAKRVAGPIAYPELKAPAARQLELHNLAKRQGTIAIPTLYQNQNDSPAPGTVVGIVLGSVAAFILLIWLFSTITGRGQPTFVTEEVVSSRRRSRSPRSRRSRRSGVTERRSGERRVIQERIVRDTSRAAPMRTTYVEEETSRPPPAGGNMVEVVEEDGSSIVTPRPPRRSRRSGSRY